LERGDEGADGAEIATLRKETGNVAKNYSQELSDAVAHLRRDKALRKLLERAGRISIKPAPAPSPLHSLAESITSQQLNGKAASAIFSRLLALHGGELDAKAILDTQEDALRSVGLSRAKAASIKDLAEKTMAGVVPSWKELRKMDDEKIIERLTQVRGIGRWTVEMLLIFSLGRPDVWPVDDFAIKKAYGLYFGDKEGVPRPAEMRAKAEAWRPWRSVVARCLWEYLDGG
jgi:3-methyladenine DNA glycosylase/8-oxoguanine DNA glycosylase